MRSAIDKRASVLLAFMLAAGCTGTLVNVAPVPPASYEEGERTRGDACGMLLFGFIPVSVNDRIERAYASALEDARATSLTDTSITEHWYFTPIGPGVCTEVAGTAITRSADAALAPATPRVEMRKTKKQAAGDD